MLGCQFFLLLLELLGEVLVELLGLLFLLVLGRISLGEQLGFGDELNGVAIAFLGLADLDGVSPTAGGADLCLDRLVKTEGGRLSVDDHVIEAGRTEQ